MAKETQQRIEGTFDEPVKAVTKKAEEYAACLRERMALQVTESSLKAELVEVMQKHDVMTVELDGDIVNREHIEKDVIKVKKKPEMDEG